MLQTTIAGIPLSNCIYNASGPRTASVEALMKIGQSSAGAVLSKSATLTEQSGNPLPRFVNKLPLGEYCEGSINSEGLPNLGIDYYISKNTTEQIHSTGKPYIVSLSGLCLEHNIQMLEKIAEAPEGIAAIELNVACPNVPNKPMIAYDFDQLETVLNRITSMAQFSRLPPIGLKLAPYFDMPHFERVAMLISKYPIKFIVCVNTIGNGLVVDWENECEGMAAKSGLGGIGGGFIKHTALANVRMFYKLLNDKYARPDIDIIGVGGVHSGRDAFELILCGAKAIQVGTCHWTEGSSCFERISKELEEIMKSKGYKSIDDFRGKLKPYIAPNRSSNNNKSTKAGTVGTDTKTGTTANESLINPLNAILILIIAVLLAKEFFMK